MDKSFSYNLLIHPKLLGDTYADRHVVVFQPTVLCLLIDKLSVSSDTFTIEIDDATVSDILESHGPDLPVAAQDVAMRLYMEAQDIYRMQPPERQALASSIVKRLRTTVEMYHGAVKGYPF